MKNRPRVVIDTNVFVSSALWENSIPDQAVQKAFQYGTVLISQEILRELTRVFAKKKFNKYTSSKRRKKYRNRLKRHSVLVNVRSKFPDGCSDKDDNMFLELAVDGKADYIISGNEIHLNILKEFHEIPILTPREFVELELDL